MLGTYVSNGRCQLSKKCLAHTAFALWRYSRQGTESPLDSLWRQVYRKGGQLACTHAGTATEHLMQTERKEQSEAWRQKKNTGEEQQHGATEFTHRRPPK